MLETMIASARAAEQAGQWDAALEQYEGALWQVRVEGTTRQAAELLRWIGTVHRERGELEVAEEVYAASLAVAEAGGLEEEVGQAVNCLAAIEMLHGELETAETLWVRARTVAEELGAHRLAAIVEQNLGIVANIRGELGLAVESYRSALESYRKVGDESGEGRALNNLGMAYVDLEDWRQAEASFVQASQVAARIGDSQMIGAVELNRTELYLGLQRFEDARSSCDRASEIFGRLKSKSWMAESYKLYGVLYRETGQLQQAESYLALAIGLAQVMHAPLLIAESQREWALVNVELGKTRDALLCLNRAHRIFTSLRAGRDIADIERRLSKLGKTYVPLVRDWASQEVESRVACMTGHTGRVAGYSMALAEAVGLRGWDLTMLQIGAYVHDIGTTALPAAVLNKPGKLGGSERELMQTHTVVGDGLVGEMEFPAQVGPIVRGHHEHWDGLGYPDRLAGEQIPLAARIVAVAEVFDGLTADRPHRAAHTEQMALSLMARDAGRGLDPNLFGTFRELVLHTGVRAGC